MYIVVLADDRQRALIGSHIEKQLLGNDTLEYYPLELCVDAVELEHPVDMLIYYGEQGVDIEARRRISPAIQFVTFYKKDSIFLWSLLSEDQVWHVYQSFASVIPYARKQFQKARKYSATTSIQDAQGHLNDVLTEFAKLRNSKMFAQAGDLFGDVLDAFSTFLSVNVDGACFEIICIRNLVGDGEKKTGRVYKILNSSSSLQEYDEFSLTKGDQGKFMLAAEALFNYRHLVRPVEGEGVDAVFLLKILGDSEPGLLMINEPDVAQFFNPKMVRESIYPVMRQIGLWSSASLVMG